MKIVMFDDHPIILTALSDFFKGKPEVTICGLFETSEELLTFLKNNQVDIVISDLITDEVLGLELIEMIKLAKNDAKLIVFSGITSKFIEEYLIEIGVDAFVNKHKNLSELWDVIKEIYDKNDVKVLVTNQIANLTSKEREILNLMVKGCASKEIALQTNTSFHTINNQKNHLISKFNCANSTELIWKLTRMGYIGI